jgi:outer membrane biosynthesis protein TonB
VPSKPAPKPAKPAAAKAPAKAAKPAPAPKAAAPKAAKPAAAEKPAAGKAPLPPLARGSGPAAAAAKGTGAPEEAPAPKMEKLAEGTLCQIEILKDGHFFIARTQTESGQAKEFKNTVFEDLLTEMLITLQEQLAD